MYQIQAIILNDIVYLLQQTIINNMKESTRFISVAHNKPKKYHIKTYV